jgi:PAS domain S-box-containing protein
MNLRINKLIKKNLELRARVEEFEARMDSYTHLYDLEPIGFVYIDRNNIITETNDVWEELIGAQKGFVVGKPINLFLFSEDLSLFYAYRNKVFSDDSRQVFETTFRCKNNSPALCRVECTLVREDPDHFDQMRVTVRDISESHQLMESMQFRDDLLKLIFTISEEMNNAPTVELPDIFRHTLKLIGLFSGADRCYICQFHGHGNKLSVTHEWCADDRYSKKNILKERSSSRFSTIVEDMKRNKIVNIFDVTSLPAQERTQRYEFHAEGAKSLLAIPIIFDNSSIGIIGLDAVQKHIDWSEKIVELLKLMSELMLNKLIVLNNIKNGEKKKRSRVKENDQKGIEFPTPVKEAFGIPDDDGFIEMNEYVTPTESSLPDSKIVRLDWEFSNANKVDDEELYVLYKGETNVLSISCPHCRSNKKVSRDDIVSIGNIVKATCTCGETLQLKIESRKSPRKKVSLNGFFIRKPSLSVESGKEIEWGDIVIQDISRAGIGFINTTAHNIFEGESFKIKFTLDNTLKSIIHKEVLVKSVRNDYVGCQFTGFDRYDVTLGFYLM